MKKYSTPELKIVTLELKDVITISAPDDLADYDDTISAPGTWFN